MNIYAICIYISLALFATSIAIVLDYAKTTRDYINGFIECILVFFIVGSFAASMPSEAVITISFTSIFILLICCAVAVWAQYKIHKEKRSDNINLMHILIYKYVQVLSVLCMYAASLV